MKSSDQNRVQIRGDDSHLTLALEVILVEQGYVLEPRADLSGPIEVDEQRLPDLTLEVTPGGVTLSRRDSPEVLTLPRPVDVITLLQFLEEPSNWLEAKSPQTSKSHTFPAATSSAVNQR